MYLYFYGIYLKLEIINLINEKNYKVVDFEIIGF